MAAATQQSSEKATLSGRSQDIAIALLVACVIFVSDLATHSVNLSILYTIVIYVIATRARGRWTLLAAVTLVGATYAGFFLGARPPDLNSLASLYQSYWFTNRSFSAAAILTTGLIAGWLRRWTNQIKQRPAIDDVIMDQSMHEELTDQVRFFETLLIALTITGALIVIDWATPSEFNFPILYAVPLMLCVLSGSARAIWLMTPLLIALAWIGLWASNRTVSEVLVLSAVNRVLATAMLLALALIGTFSARRGKP